MLNGILFPSFPSSYTAQDFADNLILIPRDSPNVGEIPTLFFQVASHGNGCDVGQNARELAAFKDFWNVNVLAYEYEGYGVHPGTPSPEACNRDIVYVFNYVTQVMKVPKKNIIIYGRSIGSGPSCYLAGIEEQKSPGCLGGVVLQSPYTSIRALAVEKVGPIGYLSPNPFDNISNVVIFKCPLLLIHGINDTLIPPSHSQELFQAATTNSKKVVICIGADHNAWNHIKDVLRPTLDFLISEVCPHASEAKIEAIPQSLWFKNSHNPPKSQPTSLFSWFSS